MLIGIISDTHDHIWNYEKAIKQLEGKKIESLIHCGDLCAPIILKKLVGLDIPVHLVAGNTNDEYRTTKMSAESKNVTYHGEFADIELDKLKIAIVHYQELADALASTKKYDFVFHGHNHEKRNEKIGETTVINPGEILGFKGKPTFAILDTKTKKVEFFEIKL